MSLNIATQQKHIEGVMMGMMKELEKLAPHPDRPTHKGPLFVQIDAHIKPAAEYDGMLGSMMLEGFLSAAFSEISAAHSTSHFGSWAQAFSNIDCSNAIEASSEYIEDRAPKQGYRLGRKGSISGTFNKKVAWNAMMKAYLKDLPRRMGLERWLADHQRKLYALKKNAPAAALTLAA